MNVQSTFHNNGLPELTMTGQALDDAGFTAGTWFHIQLYRNGLVLTRLSDDTDIAELMTQLDSTEQEGADWVHDNGEIYLAGDWLTRSGLMAQTHNIELLPGKIIIRAEQHSMLA
ncbi:SymE family type I addiction module toxin [Pectobacteriaceae bacterium CE70]|nr:SymE family type I addiction module toxin [Pectobacteriaceae bacterium CE70]WJY12354.1 SymE family type I addiction module toxin [Pectobacteriaceae bacterium C80]